MNEHRLPHVDSAKPMNHVALQCERAKKIAISTGCSRTGPPRQYYPRSTKLNFPVRMGRGVVFVI